MTQAHGYAAHSCEGDLVPFTFQRRDLRRDDVLIEILHCGVTHADMRAVRGEWDHLVRPAGTAYPCVPGHEIVGRVMRVGAAVSSFKEGDIVGVGCMVDSCQVCEACRAGLEQHCEHTPTWTYNSFERTTDSPTYGGYSDSIVVREDFVLRIRHDSTQLASVAPLLCNGVSVWSPLHRWRIGKQHKVGIVGVDSQAQLGIRLARALGAEVITLTTVRGARSTRARKHGADQVVCSRDVKALTAHASSFDLIIDTLACSHNLETYTGLLKHGATLALVGISAESHLTPAASLLAGRRRLAGSLLGGIAETQVMLDFCARHGVVAEVESIPVQSVRQAHVQMLKDDGEQHFVIDMASLKQSTW
jgi:uncharacterized zinc-type alcohol dehydrogenase-like protein